MPQVPATTGNKGRAARASNEEMLKDDIFAAQTLGARTGDEVEEEVEEMRLLTEALELRLNE